MTRKVNFREDQFIAYDEFITDSEWIIGIDPGHGGILNGVCETPAKSFKHDWGVFCEGDFNRTIGMALSEKLMELSVSHFFTTDSVYDISLPVRCARVNNYAKKYKEKKHVFISIHGNAHSNKGANGFEVWTSPGQTKADEYATTLYEAQENVGWRMRSDYSDSDPDKESRFYVLVHTTPPAILLELGFYSNPKEAKLMLDPKVQDQIAQNIVNGITKIMES